MRQAVAAAAPASPAGSEGRGAAAMLMQGVAAARDAVDEAAEGIDFEARHTEALRVGQVAFPLRTVYARKGHCMDQQWVALSAGDNSGCSGYLKIDCTARLPNDGAGDEDEDGSETGSETSESDSEAAEEQRMRECIRGPTAVSETVLVTLQVFRAEDLPDMDSDTFSLLGRKTPQGPSAGKVDPFVVFHVDGKRVKSEYIPQTKCPDFNANLTAPMTIPTMSRALQVDVYDWDKYGNNDHCASTRIPIECLVQTIRDDSVVLHLPTLQPRWINLYGRPTGEESGDGTGSSSRRKDKQGSSYRGRILVGVQSSRPKGKADSKRTVLPMDERLVSAVHFDCTLYELYCYVLQGYALPKGHAAVSVSIGPHCEWSDQREVKDGHVAWNNLVVLKQWWEPGSMPDVILHYIQTDKYLKDREDLKKKEVKGFVRFSSAGLLSMREQGTLWWHGTVPVQQVGDPRKVEGHVVGYVSVAMRLEPRPSQGLAGDSGRPTSYRLRPGGRVGAAMAASSGSPLPSCRFELGRAAEHDAQLRSFPDHRPQEAELRVYIMQGRGLNAADDNGQADPYLKIICPGRPGRTVMQTRVLWETRNPAWNQTLSLMYLYLPRDAIAWQDKPSAQLYPGFVIEVWDKDAIGKDEMLGRACIIHPGAAQQGTGGPRSGLPAEAQVCPTSALDWVRLCDAQGRSAGELLMAADFERFQEDLPPPQRPAAVKERSAPLGSLTKAFAKFGEKKQRSAAGTKLDEDMVIPVPRRLQPVMQPVAITIYVLGMRKLRSMGMFGLRSPSLLFRVLDNTARVRPKGHTTGACVDFMQYVTGEKRDKDVWRIELPEVPKYMAPLQVELLDKRAIGGEALVATGTVPLETVCRGGLPAQLPMPFDASTSPPTSPVSSPRSPRSPASSRRSAAPQGWVPASAADATSVWSKFADPGRQRYQDSKREEVDHRGLTPWLADYYDCDAWTAQPEDDEVLQNHAVLKLPGPLEDFADPDMQGFRDRFESVPLFKAEGSGKRRIGFVKLLMRIEPAGERTAAPQETPPGAKARTRSLGRAAPEALAAEALLAGRKRAGSGSEAAAAKDEPPALGERELKVRVYVMRCSNLTPQDKAPPFANDPYIKLEVGPEGGKPTQKISDQKNHQSNTCDPVFFKSWELDAKLPRDNELVVSVWDYDTIGSDDMIGLTRISLEDRWYSARRRRMGWHTERRLLTGPRGGKPQGEIELWVDLFEKPKAPAGPPPGQPLAPKPKEEEKGKKVTTLPDRVDITLPAPEEYELRAVVWNVTGCKMDDTNIFGEQMTDIYVKGYLRNGKKKFKQQDTDVHFRSMDGEGNFNWRMKWDVQYKRMENKLLLKETGLLGKLSRVGFKKEPTGVDPVLMMELWDNDLLPFSDDYIGDVALQLSAMTTKLSASESMLLGKGSKGDGGSDELLDIFELDQTTRKPKFLNAETPKIWFACYGPLDPVEAKTPTHIAEDLYRAMKGLGTNEGKIWEALGQVPSQEFWLTVQRLFREMYPGFVGGDLHNALEDELSAKELARAREIIEGKGLQFDPGPRPADAPPGAPAQTLIAARLYRAMHGWGTDEDAIYRALRDVRTQCHWGEVITAFKERHASFWGGDLYAALADELSVGEQRRLYEVLAERGLQFDLGPDGKWNGVSLSDQLHAGIQRRREGDIFAALGLVRNQQHWLEVQRAFARRHPEVPGGLVSALAGCLKERLPEARSLLSASAAQLDATPDSGGSASAGGAPSSGVRPRGATARTDSGWGEKSEYLRVATKEDYLAMPAPAPEATNLQHPLLASARSEATLGPAGDTPEAAALTPAARAPAAAADRELVGLVQLSFMLCLAAEKDDPAQAAGKGRAEPNQNPKLPDPLRPETSFSPLTSPIKAFKHILWKNGKKYIAILVCILLTGFTLYLLWESMIHKLVGAQ
eukprot:TRINITY_DN8982_c0_g1_i1.p1 TRINITY_DN8982_c0_g1~~TRINITY_DN8982_c0_g1_i1.p1  ORF type:complete len:2189 (+),score=695.87 TRINITY_DN8982_c0_g1_i1:814-6567(+)